MKKVMRTKKLLFCAILSFSLASCDFVRTSISDIASKSYTVTFASNGGSAVPSQTIEEGKKVSKPDDPTKSGYTFVEWTYDGEKWNFENDTVAKDITLNAKWSDPIVYTITYYLNGGVETSANPTSYTVESEFLLHSPVKNGYEFNGWNLNGTTVNKISAGTTGDLCLIAQWAEQTSSTFIVTFNSNGGTGSMESVEKEEGSTYVLPQNEFSAPEGYHFSGWKIDGEETLLEPNSEISISSNVTLVAQWETDFVINPIISGGTNEEKIAVITVINNIDYCFNSKEVALFPNSSGIRFEEDEQDYIRVLNKVTIDSLVVEITWDFPEQPTYDYKVAVNEYFDIHYIKYPGVGGLEGTISWSISKIQCGEAVTTDVDANFTGKVIPGTREFKKMTLEEIYSVSDEEESFTVDNQTYTFPSTSDIINYEFKNGQGYSPWWKVDNPVENYIYTEVFGKVIFVSEDGQWALLADGSHVIEVYSGALLNLNTEAYPELANKYVKVKGEITHYNGNFQLGFIRSIRALSGAEKAEVVEPSMSEFNELTVGKLADARLPDETTKVYKQFSREYEHNQLVSVTGTITSDKISGGNGRFSFELTVIEDFKVEIHYDYHTDKYSSSVKNALESVCFKGASVTIKGTLRVSHGDRSLVPYDTTTLKGTGVNLTIVPFDVSHLAQY